MDDDMMAELEACQSALAEIGEICSSYKGMRPRDEAPPPSEPAAVEVEIEAAAPPEGDLGDELGDEPEPLSLVERPADKELFKRGRGRPRKGGY